MTTEDKCRQPRFDVYVAYHVFRNMSKKSEHWIKTVIKTLNKSENKLGLLSIARKKNIYIF